MSESYATLRRARPGDADALAEIEASAWRYAYRGIIPFLDIEKYLASRGPAHWSKLCHAGTPPLLIAGGDTVAGYAVFGRSRFKGPYQAEIYELYLEPAFQGVGLGKRLFSGVRRELCGAGLCGLIVWALDDNTGARAFYENMGGKHAGNSTTRFAGVPLAKTAYTWR